MDSLSSFIFLLIETHTEYTTQAHTTLSHKNQWKKKGERFGFFSFTHTHIVNRELVGVSETEKKKVKIVRIESKIEWKR